MTGKTRYIRCAFWICGQWFETSDQRRKYCGSQCGRDDKLARYRRRPVFRLEARS